MRILIYFLFCSAVTFSFRSTIYNSGFADPVLKVGPIQMGYTTIEEAKDTLKITNSIQNDTYFGPYSGGKKICSKGIFYEYSLTDSAKGISLKAQCKKLHVIERVELRSPCNWKIAGGISIGKSFDEIKKEFGEPSEEVDTTLIPDGSRGMSQYHQMRYGNMTLFSLHKMDTEGGCCVDLIIVDYSEVSRPGAGKWYRAILPARCRHPWMH